ncbi:MAG: glycoside hydrolase family 3 C-terminal domain-containing protein, partial [Muribaculum sp.]|nr:glycoside hydrolase family 3 C-terminal domain-containing protein [Muribaculum sp.]
FVPEGLKAEYYSGMDFGGPPKVRQEEWVNYEPVNQAPDPFLPKSPLSVRWSGKLRPTVTGEYTFSLTSDDASRLYIDDNLVVDSWGYHPVQTDSARYYLEAGRDYNIRTEYFDSRDYAVCRLKWRVPAEAASSRLELFGEAGEAVRNSDVVVAVMGINKSIEREGQDRSDIGLPADQLEFLQEIAKVNPNIVLVLVAGSSLALNWEDANLPAIVNAWYPGEQGGTAVAEVLFGDYNPAGRLPLTYYRSLADLPSFDDYDVTKGRTYKYFTGDVLYPFGYGLSYTRFSYDNLEVRDCGDHLDVTFTLKNTGRRDGDEVPQVYVKLPSYGEDAKAPLRELKGFDRISLKAGEKKRVTIPVRKDQLRYWDTEQSAFVTPHGNYTVEVGASSADIRATGGVTL